MANDTTADDQVLRTLQPSDLCHLRTVTDLTLHPHGHDVVITLGWPDADTDANRSVLETCDIDGQHRRRLTDGHRDHLARFSPAGDRLVFVRSQPTSPTRIMLLDWASGAVSEIAARTDGVSDVQWLGADRLVVLAARRPDDQEGVDDGELDRRPRILSRTDYRFNGRGWINDRPNQVFVIDQPGPEAELREIGMPGVDHQGIVASPDGRRVVTAAAVGDRSDQGGESELWLLPVDPGQAGDPAGREPAAPVRLTEPGGYWSAVAWHPDGSLLAAGTLDNEHIGFIGPHIVAVPDQDAGPEPWVPAVSPLSSADVNLMLSPASNAIAVSDGFLLPGVRRGRIAVDHHGFDGSHRIVYEGDDQVLALDGTSDGSVLLGAVTSAQRPAELWRLDGPEPRRLTDDNDRLLAQIDLAEVVEVTVTAADGTEVHAFVTHPPATAPAPGTSGRPGLVYIHGGPMFQYGLNFFDEFQLAAACGYVVIGGNPRGSDGYGVAWARSIEGDLGNLDWVDITALADHLAAEPTVDPERLGIGGGSYGGFMTGWALARDQRFKAGLVERAVTSWTTMYGTSDIGGWFTERTIGATIEGDHEEVRRQSPLTYAADIVAPTLIVHSEEDWRCPIEQAEQLFSAIRRNGGQPILVRFPGENHELSRSGRPSHRIERFEIIHEFYAHHLGGGDFGSDHLGPHLAAGAD